MIRVVIEIGEDAVAALTAAFAKLEGMTAMICCAASASCSSGKRDDSRGPAVRLGRRAGWTCISLAPGTRGRHMPGLAVPGAWERKSRARSVSYRFGPIPDHNHRVSCRATEDNWERREQRG